MYKRTYQGSRPEKIVYDSSLEATKNKLRKMRDEVCFPIVNRGQLWYNNLSIEQHIELTNWYNAWLDVTDTMVIPETPCWLNEKIEKEEVL